jgi:hypothetical protein
MNKPQAGDDLRVRAEPHTDIPPDALIDAAGNPRPAVQDRFEPRYRPIEPREEKVATGAVVLAIAALLGLVFAFALDWNSKPMQNTAMNEQGGPQVIVPQTAEQNQPAETQPAPETETEQLPAQPAPEQPPSGSATQP